MHTPARDHVSSGALRRSLLHSARRWLGAAVLAAGTVAGAFQRPHDHEELPNFDRREIRATQRAAARPAGADAVTTARLAAAARFAERVPGASVARDPISGGAAWIAAPGTFLTGPDGAGGAGSAARVAGFAATDADRGLKAFLDEHRELLGHGAELLAATRTARDYVTAHNGLRTIVLQQQAAGLDVWGATLQAHLTKRGELVNLGSRLHRDVAGALARRTAARAARLSGPAAAKSSAGVDAAPAPALDATAAVATFAGSLGETVGAAAVAARGEAVGNEQRQEFTAAGFTDLSARLVWLPLDETELALAWEVIGTSRSRGEMFRAVIDADTGEVVVRHGLTHYISNASYLVFTGDSPAPMSPSLATPGTAQAPTVARTLVTLSALDPTASPEGWIPDGVTQTLGNNVDAHTDLDANNVADLPRPQSSGADRTFAPALDLALEPTTYRDAAVVDLFHRCNWIHDRLYQLGFTEAAGNFQTNNFGRGGLGNDAVQADAQDGSGTNNANFSTPPDGSPGRMQMYVFSYPTPDRDGDFDHDIVVHEYAHGLSNRLVGGGVGISAWQTAGMGEGWSDFYGLALLSEAADDVNANYATGGYATHQLGGLTQNYYFGIRRYPYSTNLAVNPLTFRDIDPAQASAHAGVPSSPIIGGAADEVHNIGEVWCVMLWEARANLVTKHGWATGNELMLRLVTDGMKLAPVNPNFVQARDAILQADLVLTGGANRLELWAGFAKRGLGTSAIAPASDSTAGVVESYDLPDDLGVSPAATGVSTGTIGGPFSPASTTYTLLNSGAVALAWTATTNASWLGLSATGGNLASGASAAVTASPNLNANALGIGTYSATVTFCNVDSSVVQTRFYRLEVRPYTSPIFTETFESGGLDPARWAISGTDSFRTQVTTSAAPHGGLRHLTMDSTSNGLTYARNEATLTLDLAGRTNVQLEFWAKIFSDEPNGPPTSPFVGGADFDGVAISANGTHWYEVQPLRSPAVSGGWTRLTVDLDAAIAARGLSYTSDFKIRFNQYDNYEISTDGIAIDDIVVQRVYTNELQLSPLGALPEGGSVGLNLSANPAPTADLTVTLAATPAGRLTVPATVTIPAGQTSASVALGANDDALLNGTRLVSLAASAPGWSPSTRTFPIYDDETTTLSVSLPAAAGEGDGLIGGTIAVATAPAEDIIVAIGSDNVAQATAPSAVVVPAGQTSVPFFLSVIDDQRIDGTATVVVSATVENWTTGSATIAIADNENTTLTVTAPTNVREGGLPVTGQVGLSGTLQNPLVVNLTSSDTTEITVPASVLIPAGQTSASFAITVVDDSALDGVQSVSLTASATGFSGGSQSIAVQDNEAHHFRFSTVGGTQIRNRPFAVSVTAEDINNAPITNFNTPIDLLAYSGITPVAVTPAQLGGWTNGVWTGNITVQDFASAVVLTARSAGGQTGSSGAFDVGTGPLHHLGWGPISANQTVFQPFAASLGAYDEAGNVVNYNGPATLSAATSAATISVGDNSSQDDGLLDGAYAATRTNIIYLASEIGGPRRLTGLRFHFASAASAFPEVTLRLKATNLARFNAVAWENTGWTPVFQGPLNPIGGATLTIPFSTPFDHDGTSNLILEIVTRGTPPGYTVSFATATKEYRAIHGYATTGNPFEWQGAIWPGTPWLRDAIMRVDWFAGAEPVALSPADPVTLFAGSWSGAVQSPSAAAGVRLHAIATAGVTGTSDAFQISPGNVTPVGQTVFSDDFESTTLNPAWVVTGTGTHRTAVTTASGPHGGSRHVVLDSSSWNSASRNEMTLTLDLLGRKGVKVDFWAKGFDDGPSGPPASPFAGGADFDGVAFSVDGANWYEFQPLRAPALTNGWARFVVDLDQALASRGLNYSATVKLRFNHYGDSQVPSDGMALDDLSITALPVGATATLGLPASLAEGATANASITLASARASESQFSLVGSAPGRLAIPANVTVPAGQTSTQFAITAGADDFATGPTSVSVRADAAGFTPTLATTTVTDDEAVAATLNTPATIMENAGPVSGTLVFDRATDAPATVNLVSNAPSVAAVPATVTVLPGQTTTTFWITVFPDTAITGPRVVTFTATRTGTADATATSTVVDDESIALTVAAPVLSREGDPVAPGTVSIAGTLPNPLIVTLVSSDPTEITIPPQTTIPAGQTTATFPITTVDDGVADGIQPYTITATANGFTAGTANGQVRDNDAHHFAFAPIPSQMAAGGPVPVVLTALDASNAVLTDYKSTVFLSATSDQGARTTTPGSAAGFIRGVWNGSVGLSPVAAGTNVVLRADDGQGNLGTSNPFDLTGGTIDRFEWSAIPANVPINNPLNVTVRAVDSGGATVPAFTGRVQFYARTNGQDLATTGGGNTSTLPFDSSEDVRFMTIYPQSQVGTARRLTGVALNIASFNGLQVYPDWTIRLKHTSMLSLGGIGAWDNSGWTTVHRSTVTISALGWVYFEFSAPFDYDGTNNLMVDLSFNRTAGGGNNYVAWQSDYTNYGRWGGSSGTTDPLTWSGTTPYLNYGYGRPELRFTTQREVPIEPIWSGDFSAGSWSGAVSVPFTGGGVSLVARAATWLGLSNSFTATVPSGHPASVVFADDFESGVISPSWAISGTGFHRTQITTNNGPVQGTRHLTMDGSSSGSSRNEATLTLDLTARRKVSLSFWAREFGNEWDDAPPNNPFTTGANFDGIAISPDGVTWHEVQPLRGATIGTDWRQFIVPFDAAMQARGWTYGAGFRIRFNHYGYDPIPYQGFAFDDVRVTADFNAAPLVTLPASIPEGTASLTGTVTLQGPAGADAPVALHSLSTTRLTVVPSVTIPAGQASTTFTVSAPENSVTDGPANVVVTATVAGLPIGWADVIVQDNDLPEFAVIAPTSIVESGSAATGTIRLAAPVATPLTFNLTTNDSTAFTVSPSASIPLGGTEATFAITPVDDGKIDGPQAATITVTAGGVNLATHTITVADNETASLSLYTNSAYEGVQTSGTVGIPGTLPTSLFVALASSNPSKLTVPSGVYILAGSQSASFPITLPDDLLTDGAKTVTVTANALGFSQATNSIQVWDNEVHHFSLNSIATTQRSGIPFNFTISARDIDDRQISVFSGPATVTAAGNMGAIPVVLSSPLVFGSGYWSGTVRIDAAATNVVLTVQSGSVSTNSNAFNVTQSPTIALSPANVVLNLFPGQTADRTVTISNSGDTALTWSLSVGGSFARETAAGPSFEGLAVERPKDDPFAGEIHVTTRTAAPMSTAASAGPLDLAEALTRLNLNSGLITGPVPSRFSFSEGVSGYYISDGGNDMYDAGNYLATNLAANITYSDNTVIAGAAFGSGGRYFTRKLNGLFVLGADLDGVTRFETYGGLGADGGGYTDTAVLTRTAAGVTYRGFVRRVWGTSDPSVNHLIVVADNGTVTHEASTSTDSDYHRVTGLTGVTRLYYLLFASANGGYVDNTAMQSVFAGFLDALLNPNWLSVTPTSGSLAKNESVALNLAFDTTGLEIGDYVRSYAIASNDPINSQVTLNVTMNVVSPVPTMNPEPPVTGGTTNQIGWAVVPGAHSYQTQAATDPGFTNPWYSDWRTEASMTYTSLAETAWHYRVRSRHFESLSGTWSQTDAAQLATGTGTSVDLATNAGSVILQSTAPTWIEDFEDPGTALTDSMFNRSVVAFGNGSGTRDSLTGIAGVPATTPTLPINQGGDLEARYFASGSSQTIYLMPDSTAFTDGSIEGYIGIGFSSSGSSASGKLSLRMSSDGRNGYGVMLTPNSPTSLSVQIHRVTNLISTTLATSTSVSAAFGATSYRVRLTASGSTLTANVWALTVSNGTIVETPAALSGANPTLTATDSTYTLGVAALSPFSSGNDSVLFDDVVVRQGNSPGYATAGSLTSLPIVPSGPVVWGNLNFVSDTSPAGTSLTVDVLDSNGNLLAANVATNTSLATLPTVANQAAIRLRANLGSTNPANTPRLDSWSVSWQSAPTEHVSDWSPAVASIQDATAPGLTVTSPTTSQTAQFTLTGTAGDANGVQQLTVDGTGAATSDAFAHWSRSLSLLPGNNTFALSALDSAAPANAAAQNVVVRFAPAGGDTDGDGVPDLFEVASGTDPLAAADRFVPGHATQIDANDGKTYLQFTYRRLLARGALQYVVEVSSDLTAWSSPAADLEEISVAPTGDGRTETVVVRLRPAIAETIPARRFVRLRVELP